MQISRFVLLILVIAGANVAYGLECDDGWFGSNCQFKCHCSENKCDDDGECTGGALCEKEWFGPACQYEDLTVTLGKAPTYEWLLDGDDTTCNPDPTLQNVTIFLSEIKRLGWVRIRVKDPVALLEGFEVSNGVQAFFKWVQKDVVDATTLDIHFVIPESLLNVMVEGPSVKALCSVHMSNVYTFCDWYDTRKIDDRCVRLVPQGATWQEAKAACEALGPSVSLVELTSNAVWEHLQSRVVYSDTRTWLGATDAAVEGKWVWSSTGNDSDIDPSWWGRGQPDNNNGNEDCLSMRPDKLLNDYNCNVRLPYFCQSPLHT